MTSHRCAIVLTRLPGEKSQTALRRILTYFGLSALIVAIGVAVSAAQAGTASGQGRSSVRSAASASSSVVTDWNRTLVEALLVAHTRPQPGTRIGAIVQVSVFNAVNGIMGRHTQFHPSSSQRVRREAPLLPPPQRAPRTRRSSRSSRHRSRASTRSSPPRSQDCRTTTRTTAPADPSPAASPGGRQSPTRFSPGAQPTVSPRRCPPTSSGRSRRGSRRRRPSRPPCSASSRR
jgi:hypothetical protein